MDARRESEPVPMKNHTAAERKSDRELVVTRTFNGPARLVFEAWTKAELFRQWWVPKSMGMSLLSCEMDIRIGGRYRLEFAHGDSQLAFSARTRKSHRTRASSGQMRKVTRVPSRR